MEKAEDCMGKHIKENEKIRELKKELIEKYGVKLLDVENGRLSFTLQRERHYFRFEEGGCCQWLPSIKSGDAEKFIRELLAIGFIKKDGGYLDWWE
ncbi:MAG: hypothetical protein WC180_03450 [Candidatus Paceibacterota bacterium]